MEQAIIYMANINDFLHALLGWLMTVPPDHPVASIVISYLAARGGPVVLFLVFLWRAIRDAHFNDTEAAESLWRLAALVCGWWPTVSPRILTKYAPTHWHPVILKGAEPDFELLAVKKERVPEVRKFIAGG